MKYLLRTALIALTLLTTAPSGFCTGDSNIETDLEAGPAAPNVAPLPALLSPIQENSYSDENPESQARSPLFIYGALSTVSAITKFYSAAALWDNTAPYEPTAFAFSLTLYVNLAFSLFLISSAPTLRNKNCTLYGNFLSLKPGISFMESMFGALYLVHSGYSNSAWGFLLVNAAASTAEILFPTVDAARVKAGMTWGNLLNCCTRT